MRKLLNEELGRPTLEEYRVYTRTDTHRCTQVYTEIVHMYTHTDVHTYTRL